MDTIYKNCRDIITKNMELGDDLIDVFTISFMALYLYKGQDILSRLPGILAGASVVRNSNDSTMNIEIVGSVGNLSQKFSFCFPNKVPEEMQVRLVTTVVYELIQLLRYKGVKEKDNYVEVRGGASSKNVGYTGTVLSTRGVELEEAIVVSETKNAILNLGQFLLGEDVDAFPPRLKDEIINNMGYYYDVRTYLIEQFMEDPYFKSLVDKSYGDIDIRGFASGYNEIMDNDAAFSKLNKLYDQLAKAIPKCNDAAIYEYVEGICAEIDSFKNRTKQLRK